MRFGVIVTFLAVAFQVSAHGVIRSVKGSNGAVMPGLSIRDKTPRNNGFPTSGSEDDTSVIRKTEMGRRATALGRSPKYGPVTPEMPVARFMGAMGMGPIAQRMYQSGMPVRFAASGGGGGQDGGAFAKVKRQLNPGGLLNLFGVGDAARTPGESMEQMTDGIGMFTGMPTTADDNTLSMVWHQVNQDGAGPLRFEVDPVSGGKADNAFVPATALQNVGGIVLGLSLASSQDFPMKVQLPRGMVCRGTVMGMENVCVLRAKNGSLAGPFGGSVTFSQSDAARARAEQGQ